MKVNIPSPSLSRQITKRLTLKVRSILKGKAKIIKKAPKTIITKQTNQVHSKNTGRDVE
jgi:hypothetical protein